MKISTCTTAIIYVATFALTCAGAGLKMLTPSVIEKGVIYSYDQSTNQFEFVNEGTHDCEVFSIVATCPCIKATADKMLVKPGEKLTITTHFNPLSIDGKFSRGAWVNTSDPVNRRVLLNLKGEVLPLFEGFPKEAVALQARTRSTSFTNVFSITGTTKEFFLNQPSCSNKNATIDFKFEKIKDKPNTYHLTTVVTPNSDETRSSVSLNFPVSGPASVENVRLQFKLQIGAQLKAAPSTLVFANADNNVTKKIYVNTYSPDVKTEQLAWEPVIDGLDIVKAEYTREKHFFKKTAFSAPPAANTRYECTVSITPAAMKTLLKLKDPSITLSYPGHKPVSIPVIVLSQKKPASDESAAIR